MDREEFTKTCTHIILSLYSAQGDTEWDDKYLLKELKRLLPKVKPYMDMVDKLNSAE